MTVPVLHAYLYEHLISRCPARTAGATLKEFEFDDLVAWFCYLGAQLGVRLYVLSIVLWYCAKEKCKDTETFSGCAGSTGTEKCFFMSAPDPLIKYR